MVRTQLYLPEDMYKSLKKKAKAKGMTFAGFVRVNLEKEMVEESDEYKELKKKFPFIGSLNLGGKYSDNEEIDKAIYGL